MFNSNQADIFENLIYNLKTKHFKTEVKNFQKISREVDNSICFKMLFPSLYNFIRNFDKILSEELKKKIQINLENACKEELIDLDNQIKHIVESHYKQIEEEFNPIFLKEWNALNVYFNGRTKIHIVLCLIFLYIDIEQNPENTLTEYEQNILYWAILLHDIAKHIILNEKLGEAFDLKEQDAIHPFKSGAVTLKLLHKNKFIKCNNEESDLLREKVESIYESLINSVQIEDKTKTKLKYIHSHVNLQEIIDDIIWIKQLHLDNHWLVDVFILVTFHQSLPNIKHKMNKKLLEENFIKQIFDLRLLELMRIVMVNDSASHSLFSGEKYAEEINESLNMIK